MAYSLINKLSSGPDAFQIYKVLKSGNFLYRLVQSSPTEDPAIQIYDVSDLTAPIFISQTIIDRLPASSAPFDTGDMVVQGNYIYVTFYSAMFFLDDGDPGGTANNWNGIVAIYDATDKYALTRAYINSDLQNIRYPIISGNYLYVFTTVVGTWDGFGFIVEDFSQMHVFDVSTAASAFLVTTVNTQRRISQTHLYNTNYIIVSSQVDEFGDVRSKIEIYDVSDPESPVRSSIWADPEPDLNLRIVSISDFITMDDILIAKGRRMSPEEDFIFTLNITDPTSPILTGVELDCLFYGGSKLFYLDSPHLGNNFLVKSLVSVNSPSIVTIDVLGNIYDTGKVIKTFHNDTEEEVVDALSIPEENLLLLSSYSPIILWKVLETDFYTTPTIYDILPPLSRTYYASSWGANFYPFKQASWGCDINQFMQLNWGMRGANDGHWYGVDASEDGQTQIAVSYGGHIAKSEDGGETWRYIDHFIVSYPEGYGKVKVSNDAKYVLITAFSGYVYLSDDYGESYWTLFSRSNWRGIAMSDSGQYMVVGNEGSGMYPDYVSFIQISEDYGSSWTRVSFDDMAVNFVGMSGDGSHITVAFADWSGASVRALAVSTDYGLTFTFKGLTTFDDGFQITDVRMSYDGQYQVISDMGWGGVPGKVWVSENFGSTWTEKGDRDAWTCIAMERNNHNHLIVGKDGWMRESFDFGDTWTEIFTGARWNDILISKDSSITMAVMGNSAIFNESYIYKKGYFFNDNDVVIISGYHELNQEFYIRRNIEIYGGSIAIPEVQGIAFHVTSATANANIHDIFFVKLGVPYGGYFIFIDNCTLNDASINNNYFYLVDPTNANNIVAIRIMGDVIIPPATLVISNNQFENIGYAIQGHVNLDNTIISNNAQFFSFGLTTSNCFMFLTVASNVNNVKMFNNTILGVVAGISVLGAANDFKVMNNIITVTPAGPYPPDAGVKIRNFNSGTLDYNCIYGFGTTYDITGIVVPGLYNKQLDPKMNGLLLQALSPCIDAGAGIAIDADVPIVDIRGIDRPQVIPFYVHVTDGTDMGCYEMLESEVEITGSNLYIVQRTNRHVVKRFDSTTYPMAYNGAYFGEFEPGTTDSTLNFPCAVVIDSSHNVFVCDTLNNRILKLNFDLQFVSKYDTTNTIGRPYAIMAYSNFIYVVGLYSNLYVRIEKLNNNLVSLISSTNLSDIASIGKQLSICRGFDADKIFIAGASTDIYETTESAEFSPVITRQISGETRKIYTGAETSSGYLYLNDGTKIIKVNSSFENVGDSNKISKTIRCLRKDSRGNLLVYNADRQSILSYDINLNFVAEIFKDSGPFIGNDIYDLMDITEVQL